MTDEEKQQEPLPPPLSPTAASYGNAEDYLLTRRTEWPYKSYRGGLGINYQDSDLIVANVVTRGGPGVAGHSAQFSGDKNCVASMLLCESMTYGSMISAGERLPIDAETLAKACEKTAVAYTDHCQRMTPGGELIQSPTKRRKQGGPPPTADGLAVAVLLKNRELAMDMDYGDHTLGMTGRQYRVYYTLMTGYNEPQPTDPDRIVGRPMWKLAAIYSKIRLGIIPCHARELGAAIQAVHRYFIDIQNPVVTRQPGDAAWTLLAVHMLNAHLQSNGFTPIVFGMNRDQDDHPVITSARRNNSTRVWKRKKRIYIESRNDVKQEHLVIARKLLTSAAERAAIQPHQETDDDKGVVPLPPPIFVNPLDPALHYEEEKEEEEKEEEEKEDDPETTNKDSSTSST